MVHDGNMSHYGSMLVKCLITVYADIFFMMAHDGNMYYYDIIFTVIDHDGNISYYGCVEVN